MILHPEKRKKKKKKKKRKKKLEAIPETIEDVEKSNELLILENLREAVSDSFAELKSSFFSKTRRLSLAMDGLQVENRKLSIECRGTKTSNRIKASQRETRKCLVVIDLLKNTLGTSCTLFFLFRLYHFRIHITFANTGTKRRKSIATT